MYHEAKQKVTTTEIMVTKNPALLVEKLQL